MLHVHCSLLNGITLADALTLLLSLVMNSGGIKT
jgi:hypothetical protein